MKQSSANIQRMKTESLVIPQIKGKVTRQAHVDVPSGTYEEEYARNGFSGRYAHIYRSEPPVNWISIEGPLRPRAFDLNLTSHAGSAKAGDYLAARIPTLENGDLRIMFVRMEKEMDYYFRNADADEVFFIHEGDGKLETDFGPLQYEIGDYIVVPRGTVYRWVPRISSAILIIESFSEVRLPDKGMLGQHALFDPAVLRCPEPVASASDGNPLTSSLDEKVQELRIQRCGEITSVLYPGSPIKTVGWKGTLTVWQLNVKDIRPVSSDRYHLPPSAHSTFVADQFVICTFLPRPLENGDPLAMKVPFYHSNIDFDEVLFYHSGDFFSRAGIRPGMMTFHPQGIHHGPQAQAVQRTKDASYTHEVAVMIDTKRPLKVSSLAHRMENINYWRSWMPETRG